MEKEGRVAVKREETEALIPSLFYALLKDFESSDQRYGPFKVERDLDGKFKSLEFYTHNCYYFKGVCKVKYWFLNSHGRRVLFRTEYRINSTNFVGVDSPVSFKVSSLKVYTLSAGSWVKFSFGRVSLLKLVLGLGKEGEIPLVFKVRT